MKHPQIQQQIPAAGSRIPWSPEAEARLREILSYWICVCRCLLLGGLALIIIGALQKPPRASYIVIGLLAWIVGHLGVQALKQKRLQLGEEMRRLTAGGIYEGSGMVANKPRTAAKLTSWTSYPPECENFLCLACGRLHWWSDAQWYPNVEACDDDLGDVPAAAVDPGGGRFVILCSCGAGHYKLKAEMPS